MRTAKIKALLAVIMLMVSGLGAGVAIWEATKKE